MDKLITCWIKAQYIEVDSTEYNDLSWSVDELYDLAYKDPQKLLYVVTAILEVDSSIKVLGALGAGSLEDLLVHHGNRCVDEIVALATTNPNFKKCLAFTYLDEGDVSHEVYEIISEIKSAC